jgi:DNA-binding response OmpR family regulator
MTDQDFMTPLENVDGRAARALIVEDTRDFADILKRALSLINVEGHIATSGHAAVEAFYAVEPDVVLLDIGLPDVNGWRVLDEIKRIRSENSLARPYVIVITAFGDPANRLMGKLQGIDAYLLKPFTPRELQYAVREVFKPK